MTKQCHNEPKWCHYKHLSQFLSESSGESESFSSFKTKKAGNILCSNNYSNKHSNPFPHYYYFSGIDHNHVRDINNWWCFPLNTVHYTSPLQMCWWQWWSTPVLNKVLKIQIVDDKRIPQLLIRHSLIQRESFKSRPYTMNSSGVTLLMFLLSIQ